MAELYRLYCTICTKAGHAADCWKIHRGVGKNCLCKVCEHRTQKAARQDEPAAPPYRPLQMTNLVTYNLRPHR